jgi:HlyD family secretion protein
MKRVFNKKTAILAVLIVLIGGAIVFSARRQKAAMQFVTADVLRGPLRNVVNATGVVQTVVTVQVGSQISGQVQELYADYNSVVKRGQLLARLDTRNFEAQVENSRANVLAAQARVRSSEAEQKTAAANLLSAKANLEAARVARENMNTLFKRASELSDSGVVSRNDYDNAKANSDSADAKYDQAVAAVEQAEAQSTSTAAQLEQIKAQVTQAQADLERALLNLEYCNIYSPVDGVVISRNVDVGQTLAASMQAPTLFTIANDLKQMQVNASVDEADIGNISSAEDVRFTVDAYPNDSFNARIAEIRLNPQTVQNVVTYSVILSIDNSEMKLRPGMTANITFTVDQRDSVLKIPNASIRYTPPGQSRPELPGQRRSKIETESGEDPPSAADATGRAGAASIPLAPGQKWDPSDKIRFLTPKRRTERLGIVWVLNNEQKPEPRRVTLGITDGSSTELLSGELKAGDSVIIGDSTQTASAPNQTGPGFFPFGGFRGGGGGRRGP